MTEDDFFGVSEQGYRHSSLQWHICELSLIHIYFKLHKCDRLQIDIFNTENPQNGVGKLGLNKEHHFIGR